MDMDITLKVEKKMADNYYVTIDGREIFTITTRDAETLKEWLAKFDDDGSFLTKHGRLLLGVWACRRSIESPYNLLQLCSGPNCVIYQLPERATHGDGLLDFLTEFFEDKRVVVVSMDMPDLSSELEADFGVKIANPIDLQRLAITKLNSEDLLLRKYDLKLMVESVFGKVLSMRESEIEYINGGGNLTEEGVKFGTMEAYMCFILGRHLYKMDDAKKKKKKNKKKKKRRGNKGR